jgi:thiol:disulfide interchange protein
MLRPYLVARWGVYLACLMATLSAWWAYNAGNSMDGALMRAVFVFVIFVAIAFGAEAVLHAGPGGRPAQAQPDHRSTNQKAKDS